VIDFSNLDVNNKENAAKISEISPGIFTIDGKEGFYFIRNGIPLDKQMFWVNECLKKYPNPPHITNLTPFHGFLSNLFDQAYPSNTKEDKEKVSLMRQLRWVTLGYHYDWTKRKYDPSKQFPFPEDLADLVQKLATSVGYKSYLPEAAIVNYYHQDSTLCGHQDDAELTFERPIVSISLGNTAVFLLGGDTREVPPVSMFLRSGDVVIMGGKSRLAYHGVPRIIRGTLPHELKGLSYLIESRININVRQVKELGQVFEEEPSIE